MAREAAPQVSFSWATNGTSSATRASMEGGRKVGVSEARPLEVLPERAALAVPEIVEDPLAPGLLELAGGARPGALDRALVPGGERNVLRVAGGGRSRGGEKDGSAEHNPAQGERRTRTHWRLLVGSRLARRDPYLALLKMGR